MCRRCANVFPSCIGDVVILSPPLVCRCCAAVVPLQVLHTMNNHTDRILGLAFVNAGNTLFS